MYRSTYRTNVIGKALVLGADSRSGLATIRSLGRGGVETHVATHRYDRIVARSRYVQNYSIIPPYAEGSREWQSALIELMTRERFDLVLATNDMWTTALHKRRSDFERLSRLYLIGDEAFDVLFDKVKTTHLARSLGIPVPDELLISREDDIPAAMSVCGLPVVLKPIRSLDERDGGPRRVVSQAFSQTDMTRQATAMLRAGPIAAQRYFAGRGVGVELLTRDGEPLLVFQHERLHEAFGSGSSYRTGAPLSSELVDASLRLLRRLRYTGVAMVEFRVNPDTGEWVLLEVNARFWGSLPLAVASGVDFPLALYHLLTRGDTTTTTQGYREGLYCRNLTMDLPWYRETLAANRRGGSSTVRLLSGGLLRVASRVASRTERIDTLTLDDPAPFFAELAQLGATYQRRLGSQLARRWPGAVREAAATR